VIRDIENPIRFYSFGRWRSFDDIAAMRAHPEAVTAIARLADLCDEATPGTFEVVWNLG
jgi:quinol monooxygenase YgiN